MATEPLSDDRLHEIQERNNEREKNKHPVFFSPEAFKTWNDTDEWLQKIEEAEKG